MISSLPLLTPQDAQTLSYTFPNQLPSSLNGLPSESTSRHNNNGNNGQHNQSHQRQHHHPVAPPRPNPLAQLRADENFIKQRKLNIQRFGATWIRPPGVTKTYQMAMDETAEREEAERLAEREAMMVDMGDDAEGVEMGGDEDIPEADEGERDLDDDVPDADADAGDLDDEELEDEDEVDLGLGAADNDEEGVGVVEADAEEQMLADRDLDDDVPEAGSYQHTDSEADDLTEDDDDDDEEPTEGLRDSGRFVGNDALRLRVQGASSARSSLASASSFLASSPANGARGPGRPPRRS
ncbi:MAG: hypothetical protein M4579_000048 [Chaenotheca gracillima]|nr:MAG: hypothetical protein M4579_000048 [Chaenotheca gracillima]